MNYECSRSYHITIWTLLCIWIKNKDLVSGKIKTFNLFVYCVSIEMTCLVHHKLFDNSIWTWIYAYSNPDLDRSNDPCTNKHIHWAGNDVSIGYQPTLNHDCCVFEKNSSYFLMYKVLDRCMKKVDESWIKIKLEQRSFQSVIQKHVWSIKSKTFRMEELPEEYIFVCLVVQVKLITLDILFHFLLPFNLE